MTGCSRWNRAELPPTGHVRHGDPHRKRNPRPQPQSASGGSPLPPPAGSEMGCTSQSISGPESGIHRLAVAPCLRPAFGVRVWLRIRTGFTRSTGFPAPGGRGWGLILLIMLILSEFQTWGTPPHCASEPLQLLTKDAGPSTPSDNCRQQPAPRPIPTRRVKGSRGFPSMVSGMNAIWTRSCAHLRSFGSQTFLSARFPDSSPKRTRMSTFQPEVKPASEESNRRTRFLPPAICR